MSVATGKIKWLRHAQAGTAAYRRMEEQYAASLSAEGVNVGPETLARYRAGLRGNATNIEPHLGKTARDSDKWERNYLRAMLR